MQFCEIARFYSFLIVLHKTSSNHFIHWIISVYEMYPFSVSSVRILNIFQLKYNNSGVVVGSQWCTDWYCQPKGVAGILKAMQDKRRIKGHTTGSECVTSCVWILQKGGRSSSGCYCVEAECRWSGSWEATLTSPSLFLLFFSYCPLHLSSRTRYGAGEVSSSSAYEELCFVAHPWGHRDFGHGAWTNSLSRSLNSCEMLFPACCPYPNHQCNHAGFPAWEERHFCICLLIHDCCGGDHLLSGLYSHWTGWTSWEPP